MTINNYIQNINKRFKTGISTEHTYRSDLQILLESLASDVLVTNEPTRIDCGAPDYIITKNNIPVGYIEAKDIGVSLKKTDKTAQLKRYKAGLNNLILTDYLDFRLYRRGKFVTSVAIAEISGHTLKPLSPNFKDFQNLIADFYTHIGQTITSASELADMMAGKARMMQAIIEKALTGDVQKLEDSSLKDQMEAFKRILIHDIKPSEFADIYAQTIAYGMFAARLNDPTLDDFSRQEAAELIPKTNPFLRRLFGYIAGPDIDDRIKWIVDALADVFRATDVAALMQNFGGSTQMNDPVIHFYETFLSKYNPNLRKSRGVWYTPEPVVNFIVRAVDDILKTEFGLGQGLADTSKVQIRVNERGVKGKVKKEVHKVQILDPAAGTGTFLAEVIKQIYKKFKGQEGVWSQYVENDLIPRLNGFEILMASYAMKHLKLDLLLRETGYKTKNAGRFRVFLTNSLEEAHPDTGTLFASWLSQEASEANLIKRDTPVMVILGNPPYAVRSSNASIGIDRKKTWIGGLLDDYKKNLKEKKLNLDDDYIKFIRYGHYFIEKNGEGVLAYISNNSFIDGITHRQMRKSLLETFDKIYIFDLHGNSKKKENCPDGSKDENVFDIMQGVSINIFIKKTRSKKFGKVFHFESYGKRKEKYKRLWHSDVYSVKWKKLKTPEPYYFFIPKNYKLKDEYDKGINLSELFRVVHTGIATDRDALFIDSNINELSKRISTLLSKEYNSDFIDKYRVYNSGSYKFTSKIKGRIYDDKHFVNISYRPFDTKWVYFDEQLISRPSFECMKHFKGLTNLGLALGRQTKNQLISQYFATKYIIEKKYAEASTQCYCAPLYLYEIEDNDRGLFRNNKTKRKPNLNADVIVEITKKIGLRFVSEENKNKNNFCPKDIFDYIYAVLHSPTYREKYQEFLKIDFPRVPYPKNKTIFWQLVELGGELRTIHLLENPIVEQYITTYPKDGDNTVTRRIVKKDFEITDKEKQLGRVWINAEQYFDQVPVIAWEFYIGGYQPAKKWLKDRYGRELSIEDIFHYQKIIVALTETDKIMKKIDEIKFM